MTEFGEKLDEHFRAWQRQSGRDVHHTTNGAAKRSKPPSTVGGGVKRIKQEDGDDGGPSDAEVRTAYEKDALNKFTVANLKAFSQRKGIAAGGKKAELVDAVTRYFETKMEVD